MNDQTTTTPKLSTVPLVIGAVEFMKETGQYRILVKRVPGIEELKELKINNKIHKVSKVFIADSSGVELVAKKDWNSGLVKTGEPIAQIMTQSSFTVTAELPEGSF